MSKKAVILHQNQVKAGKERKDSRQLLRTQGYLAAKSQHHMENNMVLICGFICFAYISLSVPFYMNWLLKHGSQVHNVFGL